MFLSLFPLSLQMDGPHTPPLAPSDLRNHRPAGEDLDNPCPGGEESDTRREVPYPCTFNENNVYVYIHRWVGKGRNLHRKSLLNLFVRLKVLLTNLGRRDGRPESTRGTLHVWVSGGVEDRNNERHDLLKESPRRVQGTTSTAPSGIR